MIGDHRSPTGHGVVPNLVASLGLTVEDETGPAEFANDFGTGHLKIDWNGDLEVCCLFPLAKLFLDG